MSARQFGLLTEIPHWSREALCTGLGEELDEYLQNQDKLFVEDDRGQRYLVSVRVTLVKA
jgi:hypothetical protein